MRYEGTDTQIMVQSSEGTDDYLQIFQILHEREFGFKLQNRKILVDNVRVRSNGTT